MRIPFFILGPCFLVALLTVMVSSLLVGAVIIPPKQSMMMFVDVIAGTDFSQISPLHETIMLELRAPRTLLALAVGGILGMSGVAMQGLFRNPLADPGLIGISSGAALGAVCAIVLVPEAMQSVFVPLMAFVSASLVTFFVYRLATTNHGTSVFILLLAGVAITAFTQASIGFMSYFTDDEKLRSLSVWQMGSMSIAKPALIGATLVTFAILVFCFSSISASLNALLLGEQEARHLGIDVQTLKLKVVILSAFGVGIAVSAAGLIGFVGLVIPHLVRLMTSPDHRTLFPLSALLGAIIMVLADLGARTVAIPAEIPVGLICALGGAPFFIGLLFSQRGKAA